MEELAFSFDAVSTGFIVSAEQTRLVADYCREQSKQGTKIFADPVMGDNADKFKGIPVETCLEILDEKGNGDC